jgi:hypothetical protein
VSAGGDYGRSEIVFWERSRLGAGAGLVELVAQEDVDLGLKHGCFSKQSSGRKIYLLIT